MVAARRAAWIEISLPTKSASVVLVAARRAAWIEICSMTMPSRGSTSQPAGLRGLKCLILAFFHEERRSQPAGLRGLKLYAAVVAKVYRVAARRAAWIEIFLESWALEKHSVAARRAAWIEIQNAKDLLL